MNGDTSSGAGLVDSGAGLVDVRDGLVVDVWAGLLHFGAGLVGSGLVWLSIGAGLVEYWGWSGCLLGWPG